MVGCSCVVVKDYDKDSQAKDVIEEYFKCKKLTNKLSFKKKRKQQMEQIEKS